MLNKYNLESKEKPSDDKKEPTSDDDEAEHQTLVQQGIHPETI